MKEFFQELLKQKTSLPIILGALLIALGTLSGIQIGGNSFSTNPTYQLISIVAGVVLVLLGIILLWRENITPKSTKAIHINFAPRTDNLNELLSKSSQIDVLGYSLTNFINLRGTALTKAVMNGASVRLIVMEPNGTSIDLIKGVKPNAGLANDIVNCLAKAMEIKEKSENSIRGKFEIRVVDWIPSCRLLIVHSAPEDGWLELGFYPPDFNKLAANKLYSEILQKDDKDRFAEYVEEFNDIWRISKPYEPK